MQSCAYSQSAHTIHRLTNSRTIFSTLLRDTYGSSEIIIGLCYLFAPVHVITGISLMTHCSPHGFGAGISSLVTGRIIDIYYRRETKRVGGDHRAQPEEFRLERTRFKIVPFQTG